MVKGCLQNKSQPLQVTFHSLSHLFCLYPHLFRHHRSFSCQSLRLLRLFTRALRFQRQLLALPLQLCDARGARQLCGVACAARRARRLRAEFLQLADEGGLTGLQGGEGFGDVAPSSHGPKKAQRQLGFGRKVL